MRNLEIREMELVAGSDANSCQAALLGVGGVGAALGGATGLAFGPAGIFIGTMFGGLGASAYAAANHSVCQPSHSSAPTKSAGMDGDEVFA